MSDVVTEARKRWDEVKLQATLAIHRDGFMSAEYTKSLAMLADLVPELIELAAEPKVSKVDTTHFCGHAPYACRLPPGHDLRQGQQQTRDPYALHEDTGIQWWREPGQSGFSFGWGHR